jgi:UPF0716 protein FxsA
MTGLILFLLFTVIPALETWLLIRIGSVFGGLPTVAYLVGMGVLGAWLGKRAGFAVLRELMGDLQKGIPPADRVVEAGLVLLGSVLLVTPGVLTDVAGTILFIAPVRRLLAPVVKRGLLAWLSRRGVMLGPLGPGPGFRPSHAEPAPAEKPHHRAFSHPEA